MICVRHAQPRAGVIPKENGWRYTWVRWAGTVATSSASLSALDHAGPWGSAAPASDLGWRSAGSPVRKILVGMSRTARPFRPEAERPPGAPRYGGTTR